MLNYLETPLRKESQITHCLLRSQNIRENIDTEKIYFCIFMLMVYIVSNVSINLYKSDTKIITQEFSKHCLNNTKSGCIFLKYYNSFKVSHQPQLYRHHRFGIPQDLLTMRLVPRPRYTLAIADSWICVIEYRFVGPYEGLHAGEGQRRRRGERTSDFHTWVAHVSCLQAWNSISLPPPCFSSWHTCLVQWPHSNYLWK